MITFKEYLVEDEDKSHRRVAQAVAVYLENCKDWKDVEKPLYRISDSDTSTMLMTRSPRERISQSKAGTRPMQDYIFSQPGWEAFPPRPKSIFCSTTDDTALGRPNLMIFPFDGVKLAVSSMHDINLGNLFAPIPASKRSQNSFMKMDRFAFAIRDVYDDVVLDLDYGDESTPAKEFPRLIQELKEKFTKGGKFDEGANGDEALAERFAKVLPRYRELIQIIVEYIPEILTPKAQQFRLQTSKNITLPGEQREVWFSGKYLSIPKAYYQQFVEEVKAAQQ